MSDSLQFFKDHATAVDGKDNTFVLNRANTIKFYSNYGITEEQMKQYDEATRALTTGGYEFSVEKLGEAIEADKANGGDGTGAKTKLTINNTSGSQKLAVSAVKDWPDPRKPGEKIRHYAVANLTISTTSRFDPQILKDSADTIKNIIG